MGVSVTTTEGRASRVQVDMNKSRFDGDCRGRNPTDRGKPGTKKSLLVERSGGPLAIVLAPANIHDKTLLEATLNGIVVDRPDPRVYRQHREGTGELVPACG
jgi:putative transposase